MQHTNESVHTDQYCLNCTKLNAWTYMIVVLTVTKNSASVLFIEFFGVVSVCESVVYSVVKLL